MTPERIKQLLARYTPTSERPTEVGHFWWSSLRPSDSRYVDVIAPLSDDAYTGGTWTGPIDPADMLEVLGRASTLKGHLNWVGWDSDGVAKAKAEVKRLREALCEAAEMTDHEQDRTIIHNHCMQAAEAEKGE